MKTLREIFARIASSPIGKAAAVILFSTIILRFPWLITSWTDEKLSKWAFETADAIRDLALPILLMFMKGFRETGGSKPMTEEAKTRVE